MTWWPCRSVTTSACRRKSSSSAGGSSVSSLFSTSRSVAFDDIGAPPCVLFAGRASGRGGRGVVGDLLAAEVLVREDGLPDHLRAALGLVRFGEELLGRAGVGLAYVLGHVAHQHHALVYGADRAPQRRLDV